MRRWLVYCVQFSDKKRLAVMSICVTPYGIESYQIFLEVISTTVHGMLLTRECLEVVVSRTRPWAIMRAGRFPEGLTEGPFRSEISKVSG